MKLLLKPSMSPAKRFLYNLGERYEIKKYFRLMGLRNGLIQTSVDKIMVI